MDVSSAVGGSDSLLRVAVSLSLSMFYTPLLSLIGVSATIAM